MRNISELTEKDLLNLETQLIRLDDLNKKKELAIKILAQLQNINSTDIQTKTRLESLEILCEKILKSETENDDSNSKWLKDRLRRQEERDNKKSKQ